MNRNIILSFLLIFVSKLSYAQDSFDTLFTKTGHVTQIQSKILNTTKKVLVHLPFKFDANKEYPVVVLLDFMAFKPLSGITEIMAYNKTIPACIVVCPISTDIHNEYSPIINDKTQEINGGKTIAFFEKELIPFLQSKYKITKKILWGQNFSGMFSAFVMLSKPGLFDAYFADLPNLDLIINQLETNNTLKNSYEKEIYFHLTGTSLIEKSNATKILLNKLENEAHRNLNWDYTEQCDSIIITHILTNYTYGLDSFFKGNKKPGNN